jgi:preprotein translocase subunit SecB
MNPPGTGYSLESVHTMQARYEPYRGDAGELPNERPIEFAWDWRLTGSREFQVVLAARLGARSRAADEIEASVAGTFEIIGDVQSVDLEAFVGLNAPALLMPYLRQALTNLTAMGPHGAYYLPPVNVKVLSEQFDPAAASGAKQLAERPSLIASWED